MSDTPVTATAVVETMVSKAKAILTGNSLTAEQLAQQLGLYEEGADKATVSKAAKKARILARKACGGKAVNHSGRNAVYTIPAAE